MISLREAFKKAFSGQNDSVFKYEEHKVVDGEVHITKITKTGKAAEKELEKHMPKISDKIDSLLKRFFND